MNYSNLDFSGHEMLDCNICDKFSNVSGSPVYENTPDDYEKMIEEYKASGSKKSFNDWASTDSLKAQYIKSGTKKPLKEWLNQDSTKNLIASLANVGAAIIEGQNIGKKDVLAEDKKEEDRKILGFSPMAFGITVSLVSITAIIGIILYIKSNK